jgi:hypothetical protein
VKVYVATSWKNEAFPTVVQLLRDDGHEVYDFRNPHQTGPDRGRQGRGFSWSEIDKAPRPWWPEQTLAVLKHGIAQDGFGSDFDALQWADACIMVQPCGVSAALELGWAVGAGKLTAVLMAFGEPDLMLLMANLLTTDMGEVLDMLAQAEA